jgi:uncharacterized phage protein (TIGR02220 family)
VPRYSLDITAGERKELKAIAKREDRSMASMMRVVFRSGLHVWNTASNPRQIRVDSASESRQNDVKSASNQGNLLPGTDPALLSPQKKKEKEKKKEDRSVSMETIREIVDDLNATTKGLEAFKGCKGIRPTGAKVRQLIQARVNEGATVDDFKTVHRKKLNEWRETKWELYLRPSTLYGPKFDEYLNQPEKVRRGTAGGTQADKRAADFAARRQPGAYSNVTPEKD